MGLRKKPDNTPEGRLSVVDLQSDTAVALFEEIALDLDEAAAEAEDVFDEVSAEILRLQLVRDHAVATKGKARARAEQVRELVK